jgi:hypothetical protein
MTDELIRVWTFCRSMGWGDGWGVFLITTRTGCIALPLWAQSKMVSAGAVRKTLLQPPPAKLFSAITSETYEFKKYALGNRQNKLVFKPTC